METQPIANNILQDFQEVEVHRLPIVKTENGYRVEFDENVRIIRTKVRLTQAQADTFNYGRKENPGNSVFTLLLLPGEKIEPLVMKDNIIRRDKTI